jgi:hypothetical protein
MRPTEDITSLHETEAGELLWKYIGELHEADGADRVNFIARTSLDPAEMAALLPLADALHAGLPAADDTAPGEAAARAQLLSAIQIGGATSPSRFRLPFAPALAKITLTAREIALLVGVLTVIGASIWYTYVQSQKYGYPAPSVSGSGPERPDCEITPEKFEPLLFRKDLQSKKTKPL